jgi:hypothetical protein
MIANSHPPRKPRTLSWRASGVRMAPSLSVRHSSPTARWQSPSSTTGGLWSMTPYCTSSSSSRRPSRTTGLGSWLEAPLAVIAASTRLTARACTTYASRVRADSACRVRMRLAGAWHQCCLCRYVAPLTTCGDAGRVTLVTRMIQDDFLRGCDTNACTDRQPCIFRFIRCCWQHRNDQRNRCLAECSAQMVCCQGSGRAHAHGGNTCDTYGISRLPSYQRQNNFCRNSHFRSKLASSALVVHGGPTRRSKTSRCFTAHLMAG